MEECLAFPLSPEINFLWWYVMHSSILTIKNLHRRGFQMGNQCVLLYREEETIHHLLIQCAYVMQVWQKILGQLGIS